MRHLLSKFASDAQEFDGHRFLWTDLPGRSLLAMNIVCAKVIDENNWDAPERTYRVIFHGSRKDRAQYRSMTRHSMRNLGGYS